MLLPFPKYGRIRIFELFLFDGVIRLKIYHSRILRPLYLPMISEWMTWTGPLRQVMRRSEADKLTRSRYVTVLIAGTKIEEIQVFSISLHLNIKWQQSPLYYSGLAFGCFRTMEYVPLGSFLNTRSININGHNNSPTQRIVAIDLHWNLFDQL